MLVCETANDIGALELCVYSALEGQVVKRTVIAECTIHIKDRKYEGPISIDEHVKTRVNYLESA